MKGKLSCLCLVLLATLVLGVGGAGGRVSASTTTVRVEVVGVGTVGDSQNGILCGNGPTRCRATYPGSGTDVGFTATPETGSGWSFDGWDGDCSGADAADCAVTLDLRDDDHEVVATFVKVGAAASFLTVNATAESAGDGGNVSGGDIDCDTGSSADCTWQLATGSTVTLVETPDEGSVFGGWGGACSGSGAACTLSVSADRSVTATFRKPKLTVAVTGSGNVSGSGIVCTSAGGSGCSTGVTVGQTVSLTATPGASGSFVGWSGSCSGSDPTCSLTVSADTNVIATFSGGGGGSTFPLSVSVSGNGKVTGQGINCGSGLTTCSVDVTAGSTVSLTATPATGATFSGWGGACSGRTSTCTLTMVAARSVTATFSGGSTAEVALSVSVSGRGKVSGGGINCGNGANACAAKQTEGSSVGLTAAAAAGASFTGWGGACSGKKPTCTVEMDEAKQVTATFAGGSSGNPATTPSTFRRVGPVVVSRTPVGFEVTLRFHTSQRGRALLRAVRAGRLETVLAFGVPVGLATVGPFPVAKPGFYTFELRLGRRTLRWQTCLGRCGERAVSSPFTLTRGHPGVDDVGALWSLTLRFRSTQPAGVVVRVYRGRVQAREERFPIHAGAATPGALLLSPGSYRIRLTATDAYGRVRTLTWYALLT